MELFFGQIGMLAYGLYMINSTEVESDFAVVVPDETRMLWNGRLLVCWSHCFGSRRWVPSTSERWHRVWVILKLSTFRASVFVVGFLMIPGEVYYFSSNSFILCVDQKKDKKVSIPTTRLRPTLFWILHIILVLLLLPINILKFYCNKYI